MANHKKVRAVDIVLARFRQLQDLELTKMQYETDIKGMMVGLTPNEIQELMTRQPLFRDDPRFREYT
jgi:hypothetical protein